MSLAKYEIPEKTSNPGKSVRLSVSLNRTGRMDYPVDGSTRGTMSFYMKLCSVFCAVALVMSFSANSWAAEEAQQPSLFERLGGTEGIEFIVSNTLERHLENPTLAPYFAHLDHEWFHQTIVAFFSTGTGGPAKYTGADVKTAHAHLNISDEVFDLAIVDIKAAVKASGATQETLSEVVGILESFRPVVVTQKEE